MEHTLVFLETFLKTNTSLIYQSFSLMKAEDFLSRFDLVDSEILSLHLSLDTEIKIHKLISQHAEKLALKQLNPYGIISQIFDDKSLFYNFMLAQGFKQPKTYHIDQNLLNKGLLRIINSVKIETAAIVLKPCSGTESIDQYTFSITDVLSKAESLCEKIALIQKYDSCLIQEKLDFKEEYKIIFIDNHVLARKPLSGVILGLCSEFLRSLNDYSELMQEVRNKIFSIDLLELINGELIILEANVRPAGIYKYSAFSYPLV